MGCAALVFAALAPFETAATPFGTRLVIWSVFAIGGYLCFRPVIAGGAALSTLTGWPEWAMVAVACELAAMPTTIIVAWTLIGSRLSVAPFATLIDLYPRVLLIGGIVTAVQMLLRRRSAAPAIAPAAEVPAEPEPPAPPRPNTLFEALPPAIGRDLLYIENEDHYVRVHTDHGNALLLMRMRDAVAAVEAEIEGARVHRGWWVARAAVQEVVRRDRTIGLKLPDGRGAPVARNMVPELRAAGWF